MFIGSIHNSSLTRPLRFSIDARRSGAHSDPTRWLQQASLQERVLPPKDLSSPPLRFISGLCGITIYCRQWRIAFPAFLMQVDMRSPYRLAVKLAIGVGETSPTLHSGALLQEHLTYLLQLLSSDMIFFVIPFFLSATVLTNGRHVETLLAVTHSICYSVSLIFCQLGGTLKNIPFVACFELTVVFLQSCLAILPAPKSDVVPVKMAVNVFSPSLVISSACKWHSGS